MVKLTVIMNDAPYGSEKTWNALRLVTASVSSEVGMEVKVFLMGDSVLAAKKGQSTPEGYYNLEKMLAGLSMKGIEISCCGTCLRSRGIKDEELVSGIKRGTMLNLANWIKESDKVICF